MILWLGSSTPSSNDKKGDIKLFWSELPLRRSVFNVIIFLISGLLFIYRLREVGLEGFGAIKSFSEGTEGGSQIEIPQSLRGSRKCQCETTKILPPLPCCIEILSVYQKLNKHCSFCRIYCLLYICTRVLSNDCYVLLLSSLVPEYEVISPFQADETGEFLSHELRKRSRRKRSTDQPNNWFYNMEAFGFKLHLNVTKSRHILAPGAIVETVHENGSKSYAAPPKNTFYSGHVVSHPGSVVAVSNHDGLV